MSRLNRFLITLVVIAAVGLPGSSWAEERPVLELSLEEAVERALENNVDIAVEKFGPESSAFTLQQAEGAYDPFLTTGVRQISRTHARRQSW